MGVLSAMVVWSECLFFVRSPTLSLFAVLINVAKTNYNYHAIEVNILTALINYRWNDGSLVHVGFYFSSLFFHNFHF